MANKSYETTFGRARPLRFGTVQRDPRTGRVLPGEVSGDGLPMAGSGERGAMARDQARLDAFRAGPATPGLDFFKRSNNALPMPSTRVSMVGPVTQPTSAAVRPAPLASYVQPSPAVSRNPLSWDTGGTAPAPAPAPVAAASTAGFPTPSGLRPEDVALGKLYGLGSHSGGRVLQEGAIDSGPTIATPAGPGGGWTTPASKYAGPGHSTPGWQHAISLMYPAIATAGTAANDQFVRAFKADSTQDPFQLAFQIHNRKEPDPTAIGGGAYVNPVANADIKAPTPIGGPLAPVPWAGGDVSGAIANFPTPKLRTPDQQASDYVDSISPSGAIKSAGRGIANWMGRQMFGQGTTPQAQAQARPAPHDPDMDSLPSIPRSSSPIPGFGLEPSGSGDSFPTPNFDELRRRIGPSYAG